MLVPEDVKTRCGAGVKITTLIEATYVKIVFLSLNVLPIKILTSYNLKVKNKHTLFKV